jgi:hypothetical protein
MFGDPRHSDDFSFVLLSSYADDNVGALCAFYFSNTSTGTLDVRELLGPRILSS